ncbi:MAG: sulfurtransferase [Anaerolineae bacterium]|jgi:thiosulfate/3-mercaptopyruvate sulfurtransferase|nr:sulfurtransferase [Anaerolineae bacterium]MBT7069301.1 sulfurtransferase [Anaerolineae bacterium]MBT7325983.1 sulfurtransferase [Anaerolineae bacterium]
MDRNSILIEADELLSKLENKNLRIFDTTILFFGNASDLTAKEKYEKEHIPGAAFFDHNNFSEPNSDYMLMVASEAEISAQIGNIGISENSEIVVYAPGILPAATRAWWILHYAGHRNVRILNGGLDAWKKAGGEVEQGERHYAPVEYKGLFKRKMLVSKNEVMEAMKESKVCVENALMNESYQAAHITGSTCLPCTDLMLGMDAFVEQNLITEKLKKGLGFKRIITYCGGGIAATVNAVAHFMIGNENVAVYDGSMYEWMSEGLPITETGDGNWAIWE